MTYSDKLECLITGKNSYNCGLWSLSCTLLGDAGACGPHDCSDLVLTAQGQSVGVGIAVIDGPRPAPLLPFPYCKNCYTGWNVFEEVDDQCPFLVASRGSNGASRRSNDTSAPAVPRSGFDFANVKKVIEEATAQANTQRSSSGGSLFKFITGYAIGVNFVSGPVTISSKTHATKWKEGWVEFLYALDIIGPVPAFVTDIIEGLLGEKLPEVDSEDFNKYRFQLFKEEGRHY